MRGRRVRLYTTHEQMLWDGIGWNGCPRFTRFPWRFYL